MTADERPPVDLVSFRAEMREAGIEEIVDQALATYLDETPGIVAQLGEAVAAGDTAGAAKTAHALKSTSGSIRAQTLAELASQAELAGNENNQERVVSLWELIRDEFDAVTRYLEPTDEDG